MTEPSNIPPQSFRRAMTVDSPPHWRARETTGRIHAITFYAALPATLVGLAFTGLAGLGVVVGAIAATFLLDMVFARISRRAISAAHGARLHTLLMGLLLGMSLPVTAGWQAIVLAALVIVMCRSILARITYLWHPVLLGRFVAQLFFHDQLGPSRGPLLDSRHLYLGRLADPAIVPAYSTWTQLVAPGQAQAVLLNNPLLAFRDLVVGQSQWVRAAIEQVTAGDQLGAPAGAVLYRLLWAEMPDVRDFLLGAVPGGIGAGSVIALLAGGLLLIYHGYVRWQLVVSFLVSAALAAAVAPLRIGPMVSDIPTWHWLPGLQFHDGMPVGPIYVFYHLLAGGLLLSVFFFAGNMSIRPITVRGQVLFGAGCGVLTILIRLYLFLPDQPYLFVVGASYLAVLLMGTLTPLIDRVTQPRPFGR